MKDSDTKLHEVLPAVVTVSRHFFNGNRLTGSDGHTEDIDVLRFETSPVSSTSVKLGLTVDLGRYESCRMDVMVTVPHYEEERDDAFLYAFSCTEKYVQRIAGVRRPTKVLSEQLKRAIKDGAS